MTETTTHCPQAAMDQTVTDCFGALLAVIETAADDWRMQAAEVLLERDDAGARERLQGRRALHLFRTNEIWISKTVLLESEWVLRSYYQFSRAALLDAMRLLAGVGSVRFEDPEGVRRALVWTEAGLDFADALHLASMGESTAFFTFDDKLIKRGRRMTGTKIHD